VGRGVAAGGVVVTKQTSAAAVHPPLFDDYIIAQLGKLVNNFIVDKTVRRSRRPPRKFVLRIDVVIVTQPRVIGNIDLLV
jgi:hypothetical protein